MFFEGYTRRLAFTLMNYPEQYIEDENFKENVKRVVFRHSKVLLRFAELMKDQIKSRDVNLKFRVLTQCKQGMLLNDMCKNCVVDANASDYVTYIHANVIRPFLVKYGFYTPLLEHRLTIKITAFILDGINEANVQCWLDNVQKSSFQTIYTMCMDELSFQQH